MLNINQSTIYRKPSESTRYHYQLAKRCIWTSQL